MTLTLDDIETLFHTRGHAQYSGEPVSQLEHALQSAQRAESDGAPDTLIAAALLHDLGHLLDETAGTPTLAGIDDRHQHRILPWLRGLFPPAVLAPISLHVDAKRYRCAVDADYRATLSADSERSLLLQGGPFDAAAAARFAALPFAGQALRLRRWDDLAKVAGETTPPLGHYLPLLHRCARRAPSTPFHRSC